MASFGVYHREVSLCQDALSIEKSDAFQSPLIGEIAWDPEDPLVLRILYPILTKISLL